MASIVVSGDVLRRPSGSNLATHLHYLIGLRKLGHQVTYLEERGLPAPGEGGEDARVPRAGLVLLGDLLRRCRVDVPVVWVDSDAGWSAAWSGRSCAGGCAARTCCSTSAGTAGCRSARCPSAARCSTSSRTRAARRCRGTRQPRPRSVLLQPPRPRRAAGGRVAADDPAGRTDAFGTARRHASSCRSRCSSLAATRRAASVPTRARESRGRSCWRCRHA